jgi:hypothetical protein
VGAVVRNKTTLPIPYRLNQLVVFSCHVYGSSLCYIHISGQKAGQHVLPPLVVMFSQTESCPHKNDVFWPTHKLRPSGMHLQRRHKITDLLKSINRNSIDAFVRLQCSFKTAEDFMGGMNIEQMVPKRCISHLLSLYIRFSHHHVPFRLTVFHSTLRLNVQATS